MRFVCSVKGRLATDEIISSMIKSKGTSMSRTFVLIPDRYMLPSSCWMPSTSITCSNMIAIIGITTTKQTTQRWQITKQLCSAALPSSPFEQLPMPEASSRGTCLRCIANTFKNVFFWNDFTNYYTIFNQWLKRIKYCVIYFA